MSIGYTRKSTVTAARAPALVCLLVQFIEGKNAYIQGNYNSLLRFDAYKVVYGQGYGVVVGYMTYNPDVETAIIHCRD